MEDHIILNHVPDSNVHGVSMGPIWGRQDPGWPHIGPMNFAIWGYIGTWLDWLMKNQDFEAMGPFY